MGPSVARLLLEHRKVNQPHEHASFFKGTLLIAFCQATLIAVAGWIFAEPARVFLGIPGHFTHEFTTLLTVTLAANAITCACIPFQQLLYSHHRTDLLNYNAIAGATTSAAVLALLLWFGWGFVSYAISIWTQVVINQTGAVIQAIRLKLVPPLAGGRLSDAPILKTLRFASNVWLVMLGAQLIAYAPIVLISRTFGTTGLATWRAGTQLLGLAHQLVGRMPQAAEPAFWQMWVNGEKPRLQNRFLDLGRITSAVAIAIGGGLIAINETFVSVWTRGAIAWPTGYDVGCAVWLLVTASSITWNMTAGITARLGKMWCFYLGEGCLAFSPLLIASFLPSIGAVPWILVVCLLPGRLAYGAHRLISDLAVPKQELMRQGVRTMLVALLVGAVAWIISRSILPLPPTPRLVVACGAYAPMAIAILWWLAFPINLRRKFMPSSRRSH
jgi:O-antigen/teichoic acid export membrane protein